MPGLEGCGRCPGVDGLRWLGIYGIMISGDGVVFVEEDPAEPSDKFLVMLSNMDNLFIEGSARAGDGTMDSDDSIAEGPLNPLGSVS